MPKLTTKQKGMLCVEQAMKLEPHKAIEKLQEAQDLFKSIHSWAEYYNARRLMSELHLKLSNKS